MSPKAFYVAVTMAAPVSPTLVRDLVARVCALCGASERSDELTRQVEEAVEQAEGKAGGDCELRFRAHDGALDVAVSAGPRQLWQISRPIA